MSDIKLLPCPFCNEELEVVGKRRYYAHKTNGCILQHLCFETDDVEAIKYWNTRKPMERIVERLEELENMNKELVEEYMKKPYSIDNSIKQNMYLDRMTGVHDAIEFVKEECGIE